MYIKLSLKKNPICFNFNELKYLIFRKCFWHVSSSERLRATFLTVYTEFKFYFDYPLKKITFHLWVRRGCVYVECLNVADELFFLKYFSGKQHQLGLSNFRGYKGKWITLLALLNWSTNPSKKKSSLRFRVFHTLIHLCVAQVSHVSGSGL